MAESIDYEALWNQFMDSACKGDQSKLDGMSQEQQINTTLEVFRFFLARCYNEHCREVLGPVMAPTKDIDVLRFRAAHLHHWKHKDVMQLNIHDLFCVLSDELAHFKLPEAAFKTVLSYFAGRKQSYEHLPDVLKKALDHHRPHPACTPRE